MNKEQQELLDEAYKNYKRITHKINEKNHYGEYSKWGDAPLISGVQHLTKDSFIQMIKINSEFSETWGLKIEEQELSLEERSIIAKSNHYEVSQNIKMFVRVDEDRTLHKNLDENNIPTRLITITYNDKTIESYE
jgi:hypothetical protein